MNSIWETVSLDSDPRFIVGYRKASGLMDCYNINIHRDLFTDLRQIGLATLAFLDRSTGRPYAPFGALEEDEYFMLGRSDIPRPAQPKARRELIRDDLRSASATSPDELFGVAEALRIIDETDQHPELSSADLRGASRFNLYAISFHIGNSFVGFIRQANPRRSLKPGLRYLQYGDTLKRMEHPDIVIDEAVDIVVAPEEVAVISETSVQVLFRDVNLVMQQVGVNADAVGEALSRCVPLDADSLDALRIVCDGGPRNAKRLHNLVHTRLPDLELDSSTFIAALEQRQLDHLIVDGQLRLAASDVANFLDFLEGRFFDDDHSAETRRADRFSPRKRSS